VGVLDLQVEDYDRYGCAGYLACRKAFDIKGKYDEEELASIWRT
jgi:hypothetical protein